jgi:putative protease
MASRKRSKAGKRKAARKKSKKKGARRTTRRKVARKKKAGGRKPKAVRKKAARRKAPARKPAARKPAAPKAPAARASAAPALAHVTHYYGHVNAAIVAIEGGELRVGDMLHFRGHTTDFYQRVDHMEIDHTSVPSARAGQVVGLQVSQRVREGDSVTKVAR